MEFIYYVFLYIKINNKKKTNSILPLITNLNLLGYKVR